MAKISTYPSADTPLLLSDRLIGTEAIRVPPSPIPLATKNFSLGELLNLFSVNFPSPSLQEVLDMGNTATQNIYLTGNIEVDLIKPVNIEDTTGSQGSVYQYLSKGVSSISWVTLPIDNLQTVLNSGNTATQNITLIGNVTSTYITPGNIKDELLNTGSVGQVLTKSTTGVMWKNSSIPFAPSLADVLSTGNSATNDINLTGDMYATSFVKSGGLSSEFLKADGSVDSSAYALASSLPTVTSDLINDGDDGINPFITALDIPAQVNSDWNATSGVAEILNKPTLPATVGDMLKSVYDTDVDGVVDSAERIQIVVRNSTGSTLTKGQIVYLSGATGNRPNAVLAQANTEATSSKTIGMVIANISNNADGQVAVNGTLHDLDTSAFTAGDTLWLSATTAGGMVANTPPIEPNHAVFIGYVARSHPNQGRVVLAIQNGYELDELHGVLITTPANNDVLTYESSTSLWKNKAFSTGLTVGTTPITSGTVGRVLFEGTGNVLQESANLFWDNTNSRLGIGTASPATTLQIAGTTTTQSIIPSAHNTYDLGTLANRFRSGYFNGTLVALSTYTNNLYFGVTNLGIYNSLGTQVLQFFGTGNLLLQNGGTFTDAGYRLDVNGTTRIQNHLFISSGFAVASLGNNVNLRSNLIGGSGYVVNAQSYNTLNSSSVEQGFGEFTGTYAPTSVSGTPSFNALKLTPTINQTGGANGITRGLFISPTLTAAADFRAIETTVGKVCLNTTSGNTLIGTTTDAGFKLDVNGTARISGLTRSTDVFVVGGTATTNTANARFWSTGGQAVTSGLYRGLYTDVAWIPTSGSAEWYGLDLRPTINQTGTANGITRGLYIAATLTSAADFRAIETTAGRVVISDTATVTGTNATSLLDLSQTWNTTGTPIALKVNITDTASAALSDLISLQVGGSARFRVLKSGYFVHNTGGEIAGAVVIGSGSINASSQLEVTSTTRGFLPPRMTTTQKNAIATPASGLVVYDTTLGKLCVRGAAAWETITSL